MRQLVGASRRWRRDLIALAVVTAVFLVFLVQLIRNDPYSAGSPKVRVTVAGGCPQSLGNAVDVSSPGPSWWQELWSHSQLARSGATNGLVCVYAGSALQQHAVMSAQQAATVSTAAHNVSTKHPRGSFKCPAQLDGVAIVVLGYPNRADSDIWWNLSGCQTADNGHVKVFQAGNASFGDFQSAVSAVVGLQAVGAS